MEHHTHKAIDRFLQDADPSRPLIICDADEVLLQFFVTLEGYLGSEGFYVQLDSFALNGNIRHRDGGHAADPQTIQTLMQQFFEDPIHTSPAVEGAAGALQRLARHTEICVLTNLPGKHAAARERSLREAGLAYPVICNTGGKGPAVGRIHSAWERPIAFIDDLPPNHDSVAADAPEVHRIHYVADPRLAKLIEKPASAHKRAHSWSELETHLHDWAQNT